MFQMSDYYHIKKKAAHPPFEKLEQENVNKLFTLNA